MRRRSAREGGRANGDGQARRQRDHPPERTSGPARFGIRLALQDVHGISRGRDPVDPGGARRAAVPRRRGLLARTTVSRPVVEALAHAGAFDALTGRGRTAASTCSTRSPSRRRARATSSRSTESPWRRRTGSADYTDAEVVKAELEVLGLGRHTAPRELLRAAPHRPRGDAGEGSAPLPTGRLGDGRRGEDRLADPGGAQRSADHLRVARRRHRSDRGDGLRVGPAEGREDRVPRVRARGVGPAAPHRRARG